MARTLSKSVRSWYWQLALARPLSRFYDSFSKQTTLGQRGEREAERFFLRQGMWIIDRGYTDKFGEIDLIAVDGDTIVFVEVKTRKTDFAGLPAEAVDERKQAKITRTAQGYLKWHHLTECRIRFDVVSILWNDDAQPPQIDHYASAFEAAGDFQMY
ncbi:MAG: YraN family protein [Planctomycetota bacterium]